MKKPVLKAIIILLVTVLLFGGIVFGAGVYIVRTPQYAMAKIMQDVSRSGMDGLRPHLTQSAQETVDKVTAVAENNLVGAILDLFGQTDYAGVIKSELQSIDWQVEDILTGADNASVVLHFDYDGRLTGRIDITLVREGNEWKISGLTYPQFETINW